MTERQRMINEITYQLQSKEVTQQHCPVQLSQTDANKILELLKEQDVTPTGGAVGEWISVKDRLPSEHESIFAKMYGTDKWNSAMWRTESDRVLVAIQFPDGTRTVDKGKLQEGIWRTGVSPVLPQVVTHWALWPELPKEDVCCRA